MQWNARKNGEFFWNLFMLAFVPAPGCKPKEKANFIVGLQLDLGPDLDLAQGSDMAAVIEPHRKNLLLVQQLMFGQQMPQQLAPDTHHVTSRFAEIGKHLAEDVKAWIQQAESASADYRRWGTLPCTIWPTTSKYALLNGGSTLLRLEAAEVPSGGLAMTIFPVRKTRRGCCFKLQIDEVCNFECDISRGGRLPSVGFTSWSPSEVDGIGGLPSKLEISPTSVWLRGDGVAFVGLEQLDWVHGAICSQEVTFTEPLFPHILKPEDNLEFTWGAGLIEVGVNGDLLYRIKHASIPKPAKKPVYALIDCSYAASKVTLVA